MNAGGKKPKTQKIGRGSHWDKIAVQALERKIKIQNTDVFVTECGLGASGFPHIGSFADASRAYAIKMAVEDQKIYKAEFFAYSDDLDGLRKVPAGLPSDLEAWLGVPVTMIPDPEGCHNSYGEHMSSLLLDSLDAAGIDYRHKSAAKLYREGVFTDQITKLLRNADKAGQIIQAVTGQEKYTESIPFHPICKECKKIYTTVVNKVDLEKHQVSYTCEDAEIGGKIIAGCGYQGTADYSKGEGKLSWKVEFASRWAALQIDFEPYGKDILESVKVNDRICREILGYEPPFHIKYEMFLDKGGSKISKSKGNVFTPQMWYRYGTPQSLILLTLKRIEGTRSLSIDDIPKYMDEIDDLSALYFGLKKEKDPKRAMMNKALYEYCWWLNPPQQSFISAKQVPYTLMSLLVQYAPTDTEEDFVRSKLQEYGYLSSPNEWKGPVVTKFQYASAWAKEQTEEDQDMEIELSQIEEKALRALIEALPNAKTSNEINTAIVTAAEENGLNKRKFYPLLYQIFLGTTRGPKIAPLFKDMGIETVVEKIKAVLN